MLRQVHPSPRDENLLDFVEATLLAQTRGGCRIVPVLKDKETSDGSAVVFAKDEVPDVLSLLSETAELASADERDGRIFFRFADDRLAVAGATLEDGTSRGMLTYDLRRGMRAVVDFCDPNATKALHIGHLRNIALGQAITCALRAAGAHVERQSHIGDAGRSMGEALAGYLLYAAPSTPLESGKKSDHYVGELYSRYAREHAPTAAINHGDAPVARDLDQREDLAQELLNRIADGDERAVEVWHLVRGWAVDGQNATLRRLGLEFERIIYDSDRSQTSREVASLGVERGLFVKEDAGTVAYATGDDSYPVMPLTRADGFPTHHLRVVAMWRDMMMSADGADLIHLSGAEWKSHVRHVEELLAKLEPDYRVLPSHHVLHGMVSSEVDGELSSSKGTAPLVDLLLDDLAARPEIQAVAREGQLLMGADDLVAMAVLGFCLDKPMNQGLVLPPVERFVDPAQNAGWRLALAWARAWEHSNDGRPDPAPDSAEYRHIVLQAQLHRRNLAVALDGLDLLKYMRYLAHLSGWYLDAERDPRVGRVMRTILLNGLGALGLIRGVHDDVMTGENAAAIAVPMRLAA